VALINWAQSSGLYDTIIIEVEADKNPENLARIYFWEKCGFILTEYVHDYIWVPEIYQAMYLPLVPDTSTLKNGKELFKFIERFHKASFQSGENFKRIFRVLVVFNNDVN